ncbi:hypothetical protein FJZ18_02405 [Candidatus Pacearchaeota archaeon]|nr:hypothetical protein [Candidatus Pacearchaeota archaeon]
MNKIMMILAIAVCFGLIGIVSAVEPTVCCEKTKNNLYCQNVAASECAAGSAQAPTACDSTSFCRLGTCYDGKEGICTDNTPKLACNVAGGVWNESAPPQCNAGCCVLGDQAAFVSLVRCKRLSSLYGLQTNFKKNIASEEQCILSVQNQDRGACVYDLEFTRTCKFTTREECGAGVNGSSVKGQFFKNLLCSAPTLGTNCGQSTKTTCAPGKDEVYFLDTCGNPANIYDSSKANNPEYWTNVKTKSESCNPGSPNSNSVSCGNCNYLSGSYCRQSKKNTGLSYVCADLNCASTSKGPRKHGESWCISSDKGTINQGSNSVGSRFTKHLCINGEEIVEQCDDFRQQECIEDSIQTSTGPFLQAACKVNRWQDCITQTEKQDCQNIDIRDCIWKPGIAFGNSTDGACVPRNSPGLKFWEGSDALNVCSQANAVCQVTYEKGVFGGKTCKSGCECLAETWQRQRSEVCTALGDCGPKVNWVGDKGFKEGFKITR